MEFRIKSIFLIPKNPQKSIRTIDFSLDKVNVITGGSEKGKSTLISIVDYCLGSGKCRIPTRKIRNFTEWFGVHISLKDGVELLLIRKEPGDLIASGEMYMRKGKALEIPLEVQSNCNVDDVKKRLNNLAGLTDLNFAEDGNKIGFNSHPSFRDFTSFLFQPQYIIANQASLFYRTDLMAHRQKLISIFNYIFQAVDNAYLEQKEELKLIERRLYELNREIEKKQRGINRWIGELRGYYSQAEEFGLLSENSLLTSESSTLEYINALRQIPDNLNVGNLIQIPIDSVAKVSNRISELTSNEITVAYELRSLKHRQELLNRLIDSNANYRTDLLLQHGRLKTSSWFNELLENRNEKCPFCESNTNNGKNYIAKLINANKEIISKGTQLNDNITVLKSESRKIKTEIHEVVSKLNEIRQELNVLQENEKGKIQLNTINSIYRFAGKVEAELSNYEIFTKDHAAEEEVLKLELRKTEINRMINQDIIDNKVKKAKRKITDSISFYAEIFKAENRSELIQFNEKDLTLTFVSDSGRTDALYEIGSGSNYMAYHISTILAFHEFFLSRDNHPSPNFVFLDQPTQVYFPENNDNEGTEKSEDVVRVNRIFEALNKAIIRTKGNLQIIILEHVGEYAWEGFENVIKVKRWRDDEVNYDDRALIPNSWFD